MFIHLLNGPGYLELVKKFWVMAQETRREITACMVGINTRITKESISSILNYDGEGKKCYNLGDGSLSKKMLKEVT